MHPTELSGLEPLKIIKVGIFPKTPLAITLPMKIMDVNESPIAFKTVGRDKHLHPMGWCPWCPWWFCGDSICFRRRKNGINVNRLTKNTHRDPIGTPLHRYVPCRVESA